MKRMFKHLHRAVFCLLLLSAGPTQLLASTATGEEKEWRFRVYLDDKEIGSHNFLLTKGENGHELRTEAQFVYKLMFIKLYEYQHRNTETWRGDCLAGIESQTDANGKPFRVSGALVERGFRVSGSEGEAVLPPCVMTFAYWDPDFLQQRRLLNTQNGEYVEVEVQPPETVELEVRGSKQPAHRYRLRAGELEMDLWYSLDREWLALESFTDGRSLRYELL
jgi:hypothetical protein